MISNDDVISYGSNNNQALVLNTNDTYHKGGYLKDSDYYRILIQAVYEPRYFSFSNFSKYYDNLLYRFLKINLLRVKNLLRTNL